MLDEPGSHMHLTSAIALSLVCSLLALVSHAFFLGVIHGRTDQAFFFVTAA